MKVSAYVIVVIVAFLLSGSLISIVLLLDQGAQSAVEKVISNLQEKTLALSTVSIAEELTSLQPVVDWNLKDYETGFGHPSSMNKYAFMAWATANGRFMSLGLSPFTYYSERYDEYTWSWDHGCYVIDGDMVCSQGCNTSEICAKERTPTNVSSAGFENRYYTVKYPVDYSPNWQNESFRYADDLNITSYGYIQNIASKTIANINGSWTPPYYYNFTDAASNFTVEYALQTLVYPLRFDPKTGLCTYSFSLDISLAKVSERLREARTSPESMMIALSASKDNYIIATSNTEVNAWNADSKDMWNRENYPSDIVRAASQAVIDHIPADILQNAPDGYFTKFEKEMLGKRYLVATRHLRDRDLLWIIIDVTPHDFHYKTLNDARVTSITIGSVIGFVALVVTLVSFVLLVSNINSLKDEMDKLATMDVDNSEPIPSNSISEIDSMVTIFNLVVKNLKLFKSLMPSAAFDKTEDEEDEEEMLSAPPSPKGQDAKRATDLSGGPNSKGSQMSKVQKEKADVSKAFALKIEAKVGVVAEIRIRNFNDFATKNSSDSVVALHGAHLTNCVDLLKDSKGILGSVNADRLTFSWNVQNKLPAAPTKACNGLLALRKDSRCSNVYAAVHYCKLLAGYMGTATIRGFQAIGPQTDVINKMLFRAETNSVQIQCTQLLRDQVWTSFELREIDEAGGERVYELLQSVKHGDEEWMYQIEGSDSKKGKYAVFEIVWEEWRKNERSKAIEMIKEFCEKNSGDAVACALLDRWTAEVGGLRPSY